MKDDWLLTAMADDNMVAHLLLRLKESDPHPARQVGAAVAALLASLPPFDWGRRHPRSNPASLSASAGKKDRERTRRSPTTPLSWSACGDASPSDGYEDSSRPSDPLFSTVRSKPNAAQEETPTSTTCTKRPRRKKTFAELKDEESCLIKDRTHLKRELDTLRNQLEEARSLNQKLKRIKRDVSHTPAGTKPEQGEVETNDSCPAQNQSQRKDEAWAMEKASFVLPDLNMMPEEDRWVGKAPA